MNDIKNKIKEIIRAELEKEKSCTSDKIGNLHGLNLEECLVEPYFEVLDDSFEEGKTLEVYVVLKERKNSDEGYHIVFDPKDGMFGLSIPGENHRRVFIGFHGSFLDTFKGM